MKSLLLSLIFAVSLLGQTLNRHYDVSNPSYYSIGASNHLDTLYDLSGHENLYQTDTTMQPQLYENIFGSLPAAYFDDTDWMRWTDVVSATQTVFVVLKLAVSPATTYNYILGQIAGASAFGWDDPNQGIRGGGGIYFDGYYNVETGRKQVLTYHVTGTNYGKLWSNGVQNPIIRTTSQTTAYDEVGGYYFGTSTTMRTFNGFIAEIRIYDNLTETQIRTINEELCTKWGVYIIPTSVINSEYDKVQFWMDASDENYLHYNPTTKNVDSLFDKSKNTKFLPYHFGVVKVSINELSGRDELAFDGTGGMLTDHHNGFYNNYNVTQFTVFYPDTVGMTGNVNVFDIGNETNRRYVSPFIMYPHGTNGLYLFNTTVGGDSFYIKEPTIIVNQFSTFATTGLPSITQARHEYDQLHIVSNNNDTHQSPLYGGIGIGSSKPAGSINWFKGNIAEIIVYPFYMDTDSVTAMTNRLYDKWFIGGDQITVISPTAYQVFSIDSNPIFEWTTLFPTNDFEISISYNNGSTYAILDTVYGATQYEVTLTDTAYEVKLKVVNLSVFSKTEAIGGAFRVVPAKWLEITSASVIYPTVSAPQGKVTMVVLHNGIADMEFYVSPDSITWTLVADTTDLILSSDYDSLYQAPFYGSFPTKVYMRVVETKADTVIYNLSLSSIGVTEVGMVYGMQYCTNWGLKGYGAEWVTDVSCGWVGGIGIRHGESHLYFDNDTLKVSVDTYEGCEPPYSCLPCGYPYSCFDTDRGTGYFGRTSIVNQNISLGRGYWIEDKKIWMEDKVNHVSYPIADLSPYTATGSSSMSDDVGLAAIDRNLVIVNMPPAYPNAWAFNLDGFDYPPDVSEPALQDYYNVEGSVITYRDYFRGIHPKIRKH